ALKADAIHVRRRGEIEHSVKVDRRLGIGTLTDQPRPHGVMKCRILVTRGGHSNVNRSFLASTFATSIPETFLRSSIDLNGPFFVRYAMIAAASERFSESRLSKSMATALFTFSFGSCSEG